MPTTAPTVARCPQCRHVLGEQVAGVWIVRYRGRVILARDLVSVECERCHAVWSAQDSVHLT